jgi:hypothetical protein
VAERMRARLLSYSVNHTPILTAPGLVVDIIREAIAEAIGRLILTGRSVLN